MGVTDWDGFENFENYVFKVFSERVSRRKELDVLLNLYGRKRMEELWQKYRTQKKLTQKAKSESSLFI